MNKIALLTIIVVTAFFVACSDSSTVTTIEKGSATDENDSSCTTKELKDKSGVKVVCNGDSIGVVLYGKDGKDGKDGADGKSAYELSGFDGTLAEWLESLKGADGKSCKAKEVADGIQVTCGNDVPVTIKNGEKGADGKSAYELSGFDGTLSEWIESLKGANGKSCKTRNVTDGIQIICGDENPVTILNGKDGKDGKDGADGKSAYELSGFDGSLAEWLESLKGADGKSCKTKEVTDGIQVTCGDEDPVVIKNGKDGKQGEGCVVSNTESSMKIVCGSDSVIVSLTGADGKTRYICSDAECSSWREATDIEKDTMGWGHDFKEGAVRNGRINTEYTYVYENKNWRLGTNLDSLLVKAGGSACMTVGDTSKVKYDSVYYVCTAEIGGSIRGWVKAPDFYNDTYEARGECKASGKYGDGNLLMGRVDSAKTYACDNGTFRLASSVESKGEKGCTSYNQDIVLILANQYSYYKCTKDGWTFTLEKMNTGSVKDSRDNRVYKTIGIKSQMWLAENMQLDYNVPKNASDTIVHGNVCNDDSCKVFGRYYTWAMAMDSAGLYSTNGKGCGYGTTCTPKYPVRGICPEGWHLPTVNEWYILYESMESSYKAMQAKGYDQWPSATDKYGFSARPAGSYGYDVGFVHVGTNALFWTSSYNKTDLKDSTTASYWDLYKTSAGSVSGNVVYNGFPVRCVKD